jgi:hypothetical protein
MTAYSLVYRDKFYVGKHSREKLEVIRLISWKQIQVRTTTKGENKFVPKISIVRIPVRKAIGNVTLYSMPITASDKLRRPVFLSLFSAYRCRPKMKINYVSNINVN